MGMSYQTPRSLKILVDTDSTFHRYVIGVAIFASMGGFLFGYDQGVM